MENDNKKPILSKRVLLALAVGVILIFMLILFSISNLEQESQSTTNTPNETGINLGGEENSENGTLGDNFLLFPLPIWIGVAIFWWLFIRRGKHG